MWEIDHAAAADAVVVRDGVLQIKEETEKQACIYALHFHVNRYGYSQSIALPT